MGAGPAMHEPDAVLTRNKELKATATDGPYGRRLSDCTYEAITTVASLLCLGETP